MTAPARAAAGETSRFAQKREAILDAATDLINRNGVKGMTFVDVAQAVNLNTTSVTYYFKRKELLAAAAFEHSLRRLETMVDEAAAGPDPKARVARYVALHFELRARIRRDRARPIAVLSDMRALDDPARAELSAHYRAIFRKIRGFFGPVDDGPGRALQMARAQVLAENMFWLPAWLGRYSASDFGRVEARLIELFERGIAPDGAPWTPRLLDFEDQAAGDGGRESFLRAATRLINERGYRGASVERIASELNVTKGSFYHHLDAKDDLVLECFTRSYGRVSLAQHAANEAGGSHWQRLASAIATLLAIQFYDDFPLLRTTALQALPAEVRHDVVERSNRMAKRFAGMMIDGITEGSVRPIDPLIASQAVMAALNAAVELRGWAAGLDRDEAIRAYASTLAFGLFG